MKKRFTCDKGSVTVEACMAFPIFLSFFLILVFLIKLACMDMLLQHMVNETAKQLAASVYPVKFINELEDEVFLADSTYKIPSFRDELQKAKRDIISNIGKGSENMLSMLITGENLQGRNSGNSPGGFLESILTGTFSELKTGVRAYVTSKLGNNYYELKNEAKYSAVKMLMEKHLRGSYLEKDKLEYIVVQFPQSTLEYDMRNRDETYLKACRTIGYVPQKDDVVVALSYKIRVPLPFFSSRVITLEHVGVERAWIKGSNGVYSKDFSYGIGNGDENNEVDETAIEDSYRRLSDETVYVTNTGQKYHKSDCPCLSSSRKPLSLKEAEERGYKRCRVCSNKGKWNFY